MYAPRAILSNLETVGKDWSAFGAICGNFPRFGVRFFPISRFLEESGRHVLRENKRISFCLSDFVKNRGDHFEDSLGKVGGLLPTKRKESARGSELPRKARQLVAERVMTSSISSPAACASRRRTSRRPSLRRLLSTLPRSRFSPTRMQPSVSAAVLPL